MRKIVTPIPKGRFIVHHIITQKRVFFFSFNIEGGGYCGIVQMSVQIFCVEIVLIWKSTVKDTSTNSIKDDETFNKYVNPGEGAHGIAAVLRSMAFTTKIQRFLRLNGYGVGNFVQWIQHKIKHNEETILLAYIGKVCDLKLLWKIAQASFSLFTCYQR